MIEVKSLRKEFHGVAAVEDISFEVKSGDVLGFLGPNGAGKSTTMKMMMSFIPPTSGTAVICGHSILTTPLELRKNVGYMPENAPLYEDMTVKEFLRFVAEVREIPKEEREGAIQRVLQMCALHEVVQQKIETLSKGFKRRVSLAQALIHDPKVLILDEPTDGLDPNQKFEVRTLIKNLAQNKDKCIVLSTHILEEVEAVCNRAIIVAKGKILFDGTPQSLRAKSRSGKLDDVFRAITTGTTVEGVNL